MHEYSLDSRLCQGNGRQTDSVQILRQQTLPGQEASSAKNKPQTPEGRVELFTEQSGQWRVKHRTVESKAQHSGEKSKVEEQSKAK